jgi:hypothetical protein
MTQAILSNPPQYAEDKAAYRREVRHGFSAGHLSADRREPFQAWLVALQLISFACRCPRLVVELPISSRPGGGPV